MSEASASAAEWVCPFCALACDHLKVQIGAGDEPLALRGGDCPRARRGLQGFGARGTAPNGSIGGRSAALNESIGGRCAAPSATIDDRNATLDEAIAVAAQHLRASRQPLFAGLGTDVAGARALYPLACACGAICDGAGGDPGVHGLRALQDRGQFTTTLAEVRTRADVIVFVGSVPVDAAPLLLQRCGIGEALVAARHLAVLHPRDGDVAALATCADQALGVTVEAIDPVGDLFATLGWLNVALARSAVAGTHAARVPQARHAAPVLRALAERLQRARYAVFIGAPAHLPAHGALVVEAVHRAIERLNRTTRAAALWLDGGNGAATANQVFAWLSGLPLRSRAGPRGLEHEPLLFGAGRLLDTGAADLLLWASAFEAAALPPPCNVPLIVLGHPAQATACARRDAVFIPVSTPGIGSDGHVFRTDGTVLMPLHALRPDALPSVADVARRLLHAMRGGSVS